MARRRLGPHKADNEFESRTCDKTIEGVVGGEVQVSYSHGFSGLFVFIGGSMSRSVKGAKGPGHEYWTRRNYKDMIKPGRVVKKITTRHERRTAKQSVKTGP